MVLVTHQLAPPGSRTAVRTAAHREALETVVLGAFSVARPCDRKANRPPGATALAERRPPGTGRRRSRPSQSSGGATILN